MRELERRVLLSVLDRKWREHLYEMDYLREGIGLRAYSQRDPLVEYQREGFDMFTAMMDGIKEESVGFLFNLEVAGRRRGRAGGRRRRARSRCGASCGRGRRPGHDAPAADHAPRARADRTPQIRAKGLDAAGAPQHLSYSGAHRGRRGARSRPGTTVTNADDEFAGVGRNAAVPLRLGQEVQEVPRRARRPDRPDHPRQRLTGLTGLGRADLSIQGRRPATGRGSARTWPRQRGSAGRTARAG